MRWAWVTALLPITASVRADDAPTDVPAAPRHVAAWLEGTSARLRVELAFDLLAGGDVETVPVSLPTRAVVSGARATVDGVTRRLVLTPADRAQEQMAILREHDEGPNRGWTLLLDGGAGGISVDALAPHAAHVELELDLEAPTCFYRDARYLDIPEGWRDALDRGIANTPVAPSDQLAANCGMSPDLEWIAFPSGTLAARPPGEQRIAVVGERLPLDAADVAHVELDIARELGAVPSNLYTALVIDTSRSVTAKQAETQRAIVQAYLQAAPHGQVQVIAYARTAHALLPAWSHSDTSGAIIDRAIRAATIRNGSNVDAGLAEAATWLARAPGTRRVIVFSDELMSSRLEAHHGRELARLLPAGTLVHAVALDEVSGELERDDDATFAELASSTEGMAVRGGIDEHGVVDATMLVRPISLDHVKVTDDGWTAKPLTDDACDQRDTLREGSSCSWWGQGDAKSGPVTIEGLVWGHRVLRTIVPDPARARSLARSLTAIGGFDGDLGVQIETAARAVDPVWSLLTSWGGKDGYGLGVSGCGCGAGATVGTGSYGTGCTGTLGVGHLLPGLELHAQLQPVIAECHADDVRVSIEVETTREEIVDVDVHVTGAGARAAQLRDCVLEGTWNTMLSIPDAPASADTRVEFPAR
jgi:hypothetical protein